MRIAVVLFLVGLFSVACSKGTNEGDALVKETREWADKVCKANCANDPCFDKIRDEAKAMSKKAEQTFGTKAQENKVIAEVDRARDCMVKMVKEYKGTK